jgi:hypothetical protein
MNAYQKEFPYSVFIIIDDYKKISAWCEKNFGSRWDVIENKAGSWCFFWRTIEGQNEGHEWYFQNEQDAIKFILKWL